MTNKEELIKKAKKVGANKCIHFNWSIRANEQCDLLSTRDEAIFKSCLLMQGKACPSIAKSAI